MAVPTTYTITREALIQMLDAAYEEGYVCGWWREGAEQFLDRWLAENPANEARQEPRA